MPFDDLTNRLDLALRVRLDRFDIEHRAALRLFAGFYEGCPDLIADLYAQTLVLFDYNKDGQTKENNLQIAQDYYLSKFPWIECVVQKKRHTPNFMVRQGLVTYGNKPASQITENGITYTIDLLMNQDASFYIDTRNFRSWLFKKAAGWQVLNTFAYTGSLGIAALAGGAARVIQTDQSKKFLALAHQSVIANHYDLARMKLRVTDFFSEVARLKRENTLFDCVILDPPFFSSTSKGTVDLVNQSTRLINKVRPLIKDGGWLVTINNALFLEGKDYIQSLEILCQDGYLSIEQTIPIPEDVTGFPETISSHPPVDPAPFNHPTKIALLRIKRK
jgi:23S rRNA (cytosine1962-C5)-methyltransferase